MRAVLRPIDLDDVGVAERVVEIQCAAYRVEADLIGFDAIPPLHETIRELQIQPLGWCGSFEDQILQESLAGPSSVASATLIASQSIRHSPGGATAAFS